MKSDNTGGFHDPKSPEGKIFARWKRALEESEDKVTSIHERAEHNWSYASALSDQWKPEDLERMEAQGRPSMSLDQIGPTMRIITGSEIINRFKPRVVPRLFGALPEGFAEKAGALVEWQRDSSDTNNEESEAFGWAYVCGYGATLKYPEPLEEVEGVVPIKDEHVPVWDMLWDCTAVKQNLVDRKYHARLRFIPEEEFEEVWLDGQPSDVREELKAETDERGERSIPDETFTWSSIRSNNFASYRKKTDKRMVLEFEWTEVQSRWEAAVPATPDLIQGLMADPAATLQLRDGNQVTGAEVQQMLQQGRQEVVQQLIQAAAPELREFADREAVDAFREEFAATTGVPFPDELIVRKKKRVFRYAFLSGRVVLEHGERPCFYYNFLTGFPFPHEGMMEFFGPVDGQIGPQDFRNRFFSIALHHLAASPKGMMLFERSLFDNPEDFIDRFSSPATAMDVPDGTLDPNNPRIKFLDPPRQFPIPAEFFEFAGRAVQEQAGGQGKILEQDDFRRISGQFAQIFQQTAGALNSKLFDSLKRHKANDAILTIEMMRELYDDEAIAKILGPEKDAAGPRVKDWPNPASLKVEVEEVAESSSEMLDMWEMFSRQGSLDKAVERGDLSFSTYIDLIPRIPQSIKVKMKQDASRKDALLQLASILQASPEGQQILAQVDQATGGSISAMGQGATP